MTSKLVVPTDCWSVVSKPLVVKSSFTSPADRSCLGTKGGEDADKARVRGLPALPEGVLGYIFAEAALASRQNSMSFGTRVNFLMYFFASAADKVSRSRGNKPSLSITLSSISSPLVSLTQMVAGEDLPLPWKATQQPSHLATRHSGTKCADCIVVIKFARARMMKGWFPGTLARANTTPTPSTFTGDPAVSTVLKPRGSEMPTLWSNNDSSLTKKLLAPLSSRDSVEW
mmetsp:Transcript_876/g.3248  ORF Transcript_876/g.3248 Transcript_876/m.3248 type:complete len:229 (+) Transcript_876:121-807(+)